MQKVNQPLNKALSEESQLKTLMGKAEKSPENVSRTSAPHGNANRDHIDAINQMFAEFELAYHNQYHKAYAQEGSVNLAKKYWLSCLADLPPDIILRATRKVVSTQEYLPSVASIIQACDDTMSLFGLPALHDAYVEACCATAPKSEYHWSHRAIYLAGKATGWFELANKSESQILPLFEYHYRLLCTRVMKGEDMNANIPEALPESGATELSKEENLTRLSELRESLGF